MTDFLQRLKQRKLVQWALAYLAAAWVLLQVLGLAADSYDWPHAVMRIAFGVIALGFVVTLLLAWYHGERGVQKVSGTELVILALLLAIGGGLLWRFARTPAPTATTDVVAAHEPTTAISIPSKSIAVLPFENLSADKDNEYFVAGMQDLILTKLADIGDLKVASRTSTAKYASRPEDLRTVARQIGVANVLEGSVQKAGDQVLINVQLIDAATDKHLWAETYQRTLDNIFGVEGEVAQKVADALHATLSMREAAAVAREPTQNREALDAYLRGRYYLNNSNRSGNLSDLQHSVEFAKSAAKLDPGFSDAFALMALAYLKMGKPDDAEAATRRALALDPDNASAHTQYSFVLATKGEFDAAIAESEKAISIQPNNSRHVTGLGFNLVFAGRVSEAESAFLRAATMDSDNSYAQEWAAQTAAMQRHYADARTRLQRVTAADPGNAAAAAELAQVERIGFGDLDAARKALQSASLKPSESAALSEAWFTLDMAARDYAAAGRVIEQAPESMFATTPRELYLGLVHRAKGDAGLAASEFAAARASIEKRLAKSPDDYDLHRALSQAIAGQGDFKTAEIEARRAIELLPAYAGFYSGPVMRLNLADVQMRAGKVSAVVALLQTMLEEQTGWNLSVTSLRDDPVWDPIRNDPRFQALLQMFADGQHKRDATGAAHD